MRNSILPITVHQMDAGNLWVDVPRRANPSSTDIEEIIQRVLMLDWNPSRAINKAKELDSDVAELLVKGLGRFLRGSTAFEDAVKTICTINTSWPNTVVMVGRLVSEFGNGAFPSPSRLAGLPPDNLRVTARVGYRADTISQLSKLEASGRCIADMPREELSAIRGLGPYAVDHIMVLRGDYSRIPVDSEVRKYCRNILGIAHPANADVIQEHFKSWGEHRFLGYKLGRIARDRKYVNPPT